MQYFIVPGKRLLDEPARFDYQDPKFPGLYVKALAEFEGAWIPSGAETRRGAVSLQVYGGVMLVPKLNLCATRPRLRSGFFIFYQRTLCETQPRAGGCWGFVR